MNHEILPSSFIKIVNEVKNEQIRGAAWSGRRIAEAFIKLLEDSNSNVNERVFLEACSQALHSNENMGSIYNVVKLAQMSYKRGGGKCVLRSMKRFINYQDSCKRLLSRYASEIISDIGDKLSIMTLSYSSNVFNVLIEVRDFIQEVLVLESRPGGEGLIMAKQLRNEGVKVKPIPDACMHTFINSTDLIVVGADMITADACVINKVGTFMLAKIANEQGVPFMVISESYKIHPSIECEGLNLMKKRYFLEGFGEIEYQVFDTTPAGLIDSILTEFGGYKPAPRTVMEIYEKLMSEFQSWISMC